MLGACTRSPEEGGLSSILIDSSLLEQIFDADQTAPKTISFTAAEAWTATLEETTRTEPSWLRLSAYSGDAGKAQITIESSRSNSSFQIALRQNHDRLRLLPHRRPKSNKRDTVQTIRTIQMIQTRLRPITNTSPGWITNSQTTAKRERRRPSRNHSTTTKKTE